MFQKSGPGVGAATTSGGGCIRSRKTPRFNSAINLFQEPSSPSSVSLPPLLDSSPYPSSTAASTGTLNDREGCSYDSSISREHVSCFSTIAAAAASAAASNFNPSSDLVLPRPSIASVDHFALFPRNVGVSAFPSLRSLQENLQVPFFLSPGSTLPLHSGSAELGLCSSAGAWPMQEDRKVDSSDRGPDGGRMGMGTTELDCMWNY